MVRLPQGGRMNDLTMTVSGWAATDATVHVGPTGTKMTVFRLASTSRYFDRTASEWVDGKTEWFTVRTFRSAALTVADSVRKGQPVTVTGRFRTSEWQADAGTRTDLVIDATSVGHDLTRGIATFRRAVADDAVGDDPATAAPSEAGHEEEPRDPETGRSWTAADEPASASA